MAGRSVARWLACPLHFVGGGGIWWRRARVFELGDVDYLVGMMLPRQRTLALPSSLANERRG